MKIRIENHFVSIPSYFLEYTIMEANRAINLRHCPFIFHSFIHLFNFDGFPETPLIWFELIQSEALKWHEMTWDDLRWLLTSDLCLQEGVEAAGGAGKAGGHHLRPPHSGVQAGRAGEAARLQDVRDCVGSSSDLLLLAVQGDSVQVYSVQCTVPWLSVSRWWCPCSASPWSS